MPHVEATGQVEQRNALAGADRQQPSVAVETTAAVFAQRPRPGPRTSRRRTGLGSMAQSRRHVPLIKITNIRPPACE